MNKNKIYRDYQDPYEYSQSLYERALAERELDQMRLMMKKVKEERKRTDPTLELLFV